jgi:hypothetical protein
MKFVCLEFTDHWDGYYFPVCGCDSVTYNTAYCASTHGVTNFTQGPCSCFEKSYIRPSLPLIHFITFADAYNYYAVRGCDGKNYVSQYMAIYYGGVTSFTKDSVPCIDSSYIDASVDLSIYPDYPVCGCDKKTYRNKYEAFFYGGNLNWTRGRCECIEQYKIDTSLVCDETYDPVCGCDRVTYKNQCIAEHHFGVQYTKPGECPCIDSTLVLSDSVYFSLLNPIYFSRYLPVCGCDSVVYSSSAVAQFVFGVARWSNGYCKCIDSTQIILSADCYNNYIPIIGCDGKFYKNPCIARYYHGIMGYRYADCIENQLINKTINCDPVFNYDPVCGCDTVTYPNACYAVNHAGITMYFLGPCENDSTCKDTFLINPLKYCSNYYDPVCGCDSITYTNECIAKYKFGVKKWRAGSCTSGIYPDLSESIYIYPNPTKEILNIYFTENKLFNRAVISDVYGKSIRSKIFSPDILNYSINIADIPAGIYLITFFDNNSKHSKKIIISK